MAGAGFELVDAVDGAEIDGIDGEAIEGVGWEGDDVAAVEAGDDLVDERGFGFVGMDAEGFGRQNSGSCLSAGEGAPLGYLFAQSLRTTRVRSGLQAESGIISVQSLPGKEVDPTSARRHFCARQ